MDDPVRPTQPRAAAGKIRRAIGCASARSAERPYPHVSRRHDRDAGSPRPARPAGIRGSSDRAAGRYSLGRRNGTDGPRPVAALAGPRRGPPDGAQRWPAQCDGARMSLLQASLSGSRWTRPPGPKAVPAGWTRRRRERDGKAGMRCASGGSSESASEFNALPEDWASDPVLMAGLTVEDDDEHDDPGLRWPDGGVVDTWREDYPYSEK